MDFKKINPDACGRGFSAPAGTATEMNFDLQADSSEAGLFPLCALWIREGPRGAAFVLKNDGPTFRQGRRDRMPGSGDQAERRVTS